MKKFVYILMLVVMLLTGCDPASCYFYKNEYIDEIERIELVEYKNEDYKMIDPLKDSLKFDPEKVKSIEILEYEKLEGFLDRFQQIIFHIENDSVNEPTGYCLLWYLKNGNFIVFCCTMGKGDRAYSMVSEFDSSYNFVKHYAYFAARPYFEDVLDDYFETYIKPVE